MSDIQQFLWKLRRLLLPLIGLALLFSAAYAAIAWLLVSVFALPLDENVVRYWLPSALSFGLAYIAIRPNLRALNLNEKRDPVFWYLAVVTATICVPSFFAQSYVRESMAQLVQVQSAADIAAAARAEYYTAATTCLQRDRTRGYATLDRSPKDHRPTNYELYLTVPVCDSDNVWIGIKYTKSVGNAHNDEELEAGYKVFAQEADAKFTKEYPADFQYLERMGRSSDARSFEKAIQHGGGKTDGIVILKPHKEPYARDTGSAVVWFGVSLGVGFVIWLFMVLIPELDEDKLKQPEPQDKMERLLASNLYRPRRHHYGPAVLIDLNIAVFVVMAFAGLGVWSFEIDDLIAWGANYAPLNNGLGLFRLISAQFVHGGLMHLANNLYGLAFACVFLMSIAKGSRLIFCYLFCGVIGNIASAYAHPERPSVGASGAVMGLWGILLVLALLRDHRLLENPKGILINTAVFAGLTLVLGFILPGVDNVAHIGGFVTGLLLGLVLYAIDWPRGKRAAEHGFAERSTP
jgi:rhomboid protease GluP